MSKFRLPEDLYDYQREDAERLLAMDNGLNFSEMGVGKTPEALWIIEKGNFNLPLIICPNSLRLEWERQISDWIGPDLCAVGGGDSVQKAGAIIHSFRDGQKFRILNYEALRSPFILEILENFPFDIIVFDEIHKLRNPRTVLVEGKAKKPREGFAYTREREGGIWTFLNQHQNAKVYGLSGSPIMNYPVDLYTPLSCVKADRYPRSIQNWRNFTYKYGFWANGRFGSYMYGTRNMEELRRETLPFTIRRTKKEVLPFLPEKYHRRSVLEMKPDQRRVYDQMMSELRVLLDTGEPLWSTNVLTTLTRLRQINLDPNILGISTSSAKTEFIMDTIESMIKGEGKFKDGTAGEKVVIFSCFEKYIDYLHRLLGDTYPHVVITGQVHPDKRIQEVKKFQSDDSIKVCLGTIHAMGEGMTLTAASNCIIADRWWNSPTNQQAEDRLHRIGQKSAVQVILPIVGETIDALLDEILERKHEASQSYYQEQEVRNTILGGLK